MNYNNLIISTSILFFSFFPTGMFAQSEVIKMNAVKSNDYGIVYFLPKTVLIAEAEVNKVSMKAGPYAKYAEKYLGITENVIIEDQVYYTLDKVAVLSKGIPNKDESYLIEFKAKTSAPFVYLTKDGMICTINAEYDVANSQTKTADVLLKTTNSTTAPAQSTFTEEYLRAGSVSKMAEVAAKQIYKLRESRMDILTGDSENAPRDGEAMKIVLQQLETQEKALVELFTGIRNSEKQTNEFEIEPEGNMENQIIFRFSKYLGIVKADDLSGSPVYMNLKKLETLPEVPVDPKAKKDPKSIIYNLPGKALAEVFFGKQQMYKGEVQVTQFGTTQTLSTSIFDDKKGPVKVYFYPETGAVKQIIQ